MSTIESLSYKYDSLEPYIDQQTMQIHHDKHHQAYFDKFNTILDTHPELKKKDVDDLLKDLKKVPEEIRENIKFFGGGHSNHRFFWLLLKKGTKFEGKVAQSIIQKYGSYDKFKEEFKNAALSLKGSGWTWLVYEKELEIINTSNQDSPLSLGKIPLLTLDMWEHAYYLKYQNQKADYVDNFFHIINWEQIENNYQKTLKK